MNIGTTERPLNIEYDFERDVVTINDVPYSVQLFRTMHSPLSDGLYRIWRDRETGVVTLQLVERDDWPDEIDV